MNLENQRGALLAYCGKTGISAAYVVEMLEWLEDENCAIVSANFFRGNFEAVLTAYSAELQGLQSARVRQFAKKGIRRGRKAKIDKCGCLENFLDARKAQKPGEPWHVFQGEPKLHGTWLKRTRSSRKPNGDRIGYKPRRPSKGRVLVANGVSAA